VTSIPNLNARQAEKLARSLGWVVLARRRTGELRFIAPDGRRFNTKARGRSGDAQRKLCIALARAAAETAS
jgi:hypothetical protein